jgi:hypothetical protein
VRLIALLLAAVMFTAGLAQVVCASPDVAAAIDDGADDPPIVPEVITIDVAERRVGAELVLPPGPAPGRRHDMLVFRPPRELASP